MKSCYGEYPEAKLSTADVVKAHRLREVIIDVLKSHRDEGRDTVFICDEDLEDVLKILIQMTTTVVESVNDEGLKTCQRLDILPPEENVNIDDYLNN